MNLYEQAAKLLKDGKYTVALTGAGLSTESGIPDFRSSTGYYANIIPEDALSNDVMYNEPERFYKEGYQILKDLEGKKPNDAHFALTKLQEMGLMHEIITQNIDNLHQLAESRDVLPVHGDASHGHCESCQSVYSFEEIDDLVQGGEIPPRCPKCGGLVRTNVVLFGDAMPVEFERAIQATERADTMVVIGSSLRVMPVAYLPRQVKNLIIINKDMTPYDGYADVVIHESAAVALTRILECLK
ncbi:NAD-dependent deacylase [Peptoniphilus sp. KCTC 25270]|uniref:SIR2 family NAD-dependent protein deacylase n=1 Tax=Peptoniphilus sp. KCTC 25270 TaxID=2897414 RepID=UPI001E346F3B|nr:NAD-dependent deacylase [Peptoniphilus sp. KCTC 25270]MCD1147996.1 NAD-dependent deacylase [Peptoniphilus sp. KCTC 25270]